MCGLQGGRLPPFPGSHWRWEGSVSRTRTHSASPHCTPLNNSKTSHRATFERGPPFPPALQPTLSCLAEEWVRKGAGICKCDYWEARALQH